MKKVLVTFGFQEASAWLELTAPLMMKYAMRHGYDFYVVHEPEEIYKPHSWFKLDVFDRVLGVGDSCWNLALWLDADVVIKDFSVDIASLLQKETRLANVVHQTDVHGLVPNCGVWLIKNYSPLFSTKSDLEDRIWEQGRYCKYLGGNDAFPLEFPDGFPSWFQELPYEWNVTLWDKRGIPDNLRFFHATASRDPEEKLALIKEWVDK